MKSPGIVRPVDPLGRIVVPIELRRKLGIDCGERVEIFAEGSSIVIRKYEPNCIFCGSSKTVLSIKGKNVCSSCLKEMQEHPQEK